MRPVILANNVSSLPRPTFKPGFTRVPRCLTMIVPPGTSCPPKALNPSRCEFESRPLRDVPCPFLCAIRSSYHPKLRRPACCREGNLPWLLTSFSLAQPSCAPSCSPASSPQPSYAPPSFYLSSLPPSPREPPSSPSAP